MIQSVTQYVIKKKKSIITIQLIFGWIITLFFGFCTLGSAFDLEEPESSVFIIFLILSSCGAFLLYLGYKNKRLIWLYYHYIAIISTEPNISIEKLATYVNVSNVKAKKNVIKLLASGFFSDYLIDLNTNCLNLDRPQQPVDYTPTFSSFNNTNNSRFNTAICSNCGTINNIGKSTNGRCGSCGAQIIS